MGAATRAVPGQMESSGREKLHAFQTGAQRVCAPLCAGRARAEGLFRPLGLSELRKKLRRERCFARAGDQRYDLDRHLSLVRQLRAAGAS